jgi:hypothetical protein
VSESTGASANDSWHFSAREVITAVLAEHRASLWAHITAYALAAALPIGQYALRAVA